jgi:hypothetical protein
MESQAAGKRNSWLSHVKKTMKAHKGKSFKAVLKMAKKTYKSSKKGGALSPMPVSSETGPIAGGRRKTRRSTKKGGRKH